MAIKNEDQELKQYQNPLFQNDEWLLEHQAIAGEELATTSGTYNKMLALFIALAIVTFVSFHYIEIRSGKAILGLFGGLLGTSICIAKNPRRSVVLSPLFITLEGIVLGLMIQVYEAAYPGVPLNAALITFGITLVVYIMYRTKVIEVNEVFKTKTALLTFGIFILYSCDLIMILFFNTSIPLIHECSWQAVAASLFFLYVASMNLFWDFDYIENVDSYNLPKSFEWYFGVSLVATIVWLFSEVLSLIRKLTNIL